MRKILDFIKKYWRDITIILGILICSVSTIFIVRCATSKTAVSARIYQQNTVVLTINLSTQTEEVKEIEFPNKDIKMTIGIKKNSICVLRCDCPNQDCVNIGWVSTSGKPIICAHYKVTIEVIDSSITDVDIG